MITNAVVATDPILGQTPRGTDILAPSGHLLITGPAGSGKSTLAAHLAAQYRADPRTAVGILTGHRCTFESWIGDDHLREEMTFDELKYGLVETANDFEMPDGADRAVLVLDDMPFADPEIFNAVQRLLSHGRAHGIQVVVSSAPQAESVLSPLRNWCSAHVRMQGRQKPGAFRLSTVGLDGCVVGQLAWPG